MNVKRGIMISEIAFSNMPILLKNAGLDFFILDCEHGGFDYSNVSKIIVTARLCGLFIIIRLANNQRKDIIKFMDMGADGLLLPMTNSASDIKEVVKYAKYAPLGERGISTMRAHTLYNPPSICEYTSEANARTKIYAQIETKEGVANQEEILSVEGVDGAFIGPNDLSADYGCLQDGNASDILLAIEQVGQTAKVLQKQAGIITTNTSYLQKAKESAFSLYSQGSELNAIFEYCKHIVEGEI